MHALLIALIVGHAAPERFAPPSPTNEREWIIYWDYPWSHAPFGGSGFTQADIFVDTAGKPQSCSVDHTSGWDDFDRQTCAGIMKRGRFKPARNEAGKRMNGVFRFTVHWGKSNGFPDFPADTALAVPDLPEGNPNARVTLNYLVDETGHITRCAIAKSSGAPKFDALACRAMPTRYTFAPARDAAGKAWPVARSQTVGFELGK